MHTYTRYNEESRHTWPVTVDGDVRWADTDKAIELAYGTKPINVAMYKDGLGGFRGFAIHLYQGTFYTISNDGTATDKHIQQGWTPFDRFVTQYDADPRWTRMDEQPVDALRAQPLTTAPSSKSVAARSSAHCARKTPRCTSSRWMTALDAPVAAGVPCRSSAACWLLLWLCGSW